MKQTRLLMGMPVTIEVVDASVSTRDIAKVFSYFEYIDAKFSPFKTTSEVSRFNQKKISPSHFTSDMKTVFRLCRAGADLATNSFAKVSTRQKIFRFVS